ncbi:hypothetical protein [Peribacillus sp. NPDC097895]|uniref:hypothetical protein n=1 Tax=Peribacillus sp. NPDC097895 TaxID=3390619 RepID=UPI003D00FA31
MQTKTLHKRLDQKQENLKSLMDMQDDVVFKEVFIPGYESTGLSKAVINYEVDIRIGDFGSKGGIK